MRQAYEDEDNAPMFGDVPLPYPIRTWAEMIDAWEGEHNADGQGAISGGLETDRNGEERKRWLGMRGMRKTMPETGRTV